MATAAAAVASKAAATMAAVKVGATAATAVGSAAALCHIAAFTLMCVWIAWKKRSAEGGGLGVQEASVFRHKGGSSGAVSEEEPKEEEEEWRSVAMTGGGGCKGLEEQKEEVEEKEEWRSVDTTGGGCGGGCEGVFPAQRAWVKSGPALAPALRTQSRRT